jgi:aryl-alcohol dehydrogenase-like predicted oxidoreductase
MALSFPVSPIHATMSPAVCQSTGIPLVLGGHSFIAQLGNDPPAAAREQREIVESCLDHGITWFDTTYQPERIALGEALQALGRRNEATILAWNFFTDFRPGDPVGKPEYYRPRHIEVILEQLRTTWVDGLVVVALDDPEENRRQRELLIDWRRRGYVRSLGLWASDRATVLSQGTDTPFAFGVGPFNVTTRDAASVFAACKKSGWQTLATSPFVRGWELDRMTAAAAAGGCGAPEALRPRLADLMLRFSLFQPDVDRVIVGMRRLEWVARNLESVSRGPLTTEERRWLRRVRRLTARRRRWQRLRRLFARRAAPPVPSGS